MIDLHCHILPGLDDGAADEEEALEMARRAAADGIRTVVATPHHLNRRFVNGRTAVEAAAERFSERLRQERIPLTVLPGQELHCGSALIQTLYEDGNWLSLNRSKYVLLEFPAAEVPAHAGEAVHELLVLGCVPIIAHPERNRGIAEDPERLFRLVEAGALAQVTSHSLVGRFGRKVQKLAAELCRRNLIHFVASDAHNLTGRPFLLREAYEWVRRELGGDMERWYRSNAEAVIADGEVERREPLGRRRMWGFIWRFRGAGR